MELHQLTAHKIHQLLNEKKASSVEVTKSVFARIKQVDQEIKAYLTLTEEQALAQAREIDEKIAQGDVIAPLAGIPGAMKDNICTQGVLTTCASQILKNYLPPYDATAVKKLKEQGAINLGKLNMDEFAAGSSTENSSMHPTYNPWNLNKVPGGSSGGSAAAVAADEAIFALGSDTGGSIRQPAAYCGVVGLKPTFGLVSRYGLVAFASSLEQLGPMTKDVTDCALVLNALAGHDPFDAITVNQEVPNYMHSLVNDVKGLKIGVPKEYFAEGIEPEVEQLIKAALAKYEELGALVEEISLPMTEYALPAYYIIASAEASSNLARYDGVRYGIGREEAADIFSMYSKARGAGFGQEVKRRILFGTYALSAENYAAYYLQALKTRTLVKREMEEALAKYDLLLTPTTPATAFEIGAAGAEPLNMYASDICTIPVNLAGVPALSIPCGFSKGLPVGLQLIGKAFGENILLRAAYTFEQNSEFHLQKATLTRG